MLRRCGANSLSRNTRSSCIACTRLGEVLRSTCSGSKKRQKWHWPGQFGKDGSGSSGGPVAAVGGQGAARREPLRELGDPVGALEAPFGACPGQATLSCNCSCASSCSRGFPSNCGPSSRQKERGIGCTLREEAPATRSGKRRRPWISPLWAQAQPFAARARPRLVTSPPAEPRRKFTVKNAVPLECTWSRTW